MQMEKPEATIRVFVVSNQPIFLFGLQVQLEVLDPQINIIGVSDDATKAMVSIAEVSPDIVLMDLNLHVSAFTSIEATSKLKNEIPAAQVIILTADDTVDSIMNALKAGASGYLLKTVTIVELQEAIYAVHKGGSVLTPAVAQKVLSVMSHPVVKLLTATDREIEILELLAFGSTNKSIARELSLSVRTVEAHVHKIFQKFGVASRTEAVMAAIRAGLISAPTEQKQA